MPPVVTLMVRHPGDVVMAAGEPGLMPTTEGALNIRQNLTETIDGCPLGWSIPSRISRSAAPM